MPRDSQPTWIWTFGKYLPVVIAALIVGGAIAPIAWQVATPDSDGVVAVIELEGPITTDSAQEIQAYLADARENSSIKAVVLSVDSPGGSAAASEALYLAVRKTAREMPVTASVQGIGASGAYYALLPAETIYVTPASLVGSVGVRTSVPSQGNFPSQIMTGPDKIGGRTADEARAQVETIQRVFVESVFKHRRERLTLTREQVSYAKVYTGTEAVRNGMADEIGGIGSAVEQAAAHAGLERFETTRRASGDNRWALRSTTAGNQTTLVQNEPFDYQRVDRPRFLMLYGTIEREEVIINASR